MNKETLIEVQNLNVYYGENHILKDINIGFQDKKLTAIIGPSGCGKTTLFKTLNRLLEADDSVRIEGNVFVGNENIYDPKTEITHIRKKMGLLNQRPTPLPMSIFDNVTFGLKIHGLKDKKILAEKAEKYLKIASLWDELKDRLDKPAASLSIGQQQRLCLARGLAVEPEVILGDEPTSALDPISTRHIEQKFIELKEQYTIIMVTHILRQAKRLADHIVFMYMGEIIEQGPTQEIFENPKEKLTKDYISGAFS
jgi:phosphate transport system ATP-binding protein